MILLRKLEIALVVAGNAENGPRSVVHQHEIRDVHGQPPLAVERVHSLNFGLVSLFLGGLDLGRAGPAGAALVDEPLRLGIRLSDRSSQGMLSRYCDEGSAEDRVG